VKLASKNNPLNHNQLEQLAEEEGHRKFWDFVLKDDQSVSTVVLANVHNWIDDKNGLV